MWNCPSCDRTFTKTNQVHFCGDKTVADFLVGKKETALLLFDELLAQLQSIGPIKLYATKSMIVIAAEFRFAYVIAIGKNFIDVVLPFDQPEEDQLCFRKVGQVPGTRQFNHHLRLMYLEDFNEEVIGYLNKAYANGKAV